MEETKRQLAIGLVELLEQIAVLDTNYILLAIILVSAIIVLDAVTQFVRHERKGSGMDLKATQTVSIDGSETLPVRDYVSDIQGLAGRPDALIREHGFVIPVERKPLSKKLRDRHVAQLLVYMRLIEEFEGKKPPYGYLILGPSCRRFKIENSEKRQAWLQKSIDEMRDFLEKDKPLTPSPQRQKCRKCPVRESCEHRADLAPDVKSKSASLRSGANRAHSK